MPSFPELAVAIIGTGRIAHDHAQALQTGNTCRLATVFDRTPEVATAFGSRFQTTVSDSLELLVTQARPDGVILCTPPATHFELCRFFLSHQIPVLCEKPLVIQPEEAASLYQLTQTHHTQLVLATKFRFAPDIQIAKKLMTDKKFGNVFQAEITFEAEVDMSDRWNILPEISGGGVLIDNGSHAVDLARYLFGPLASLKASLAFQKPLPVEDTATIELISQSGVQILVRLSWSRTSSHHWFLKLTGSQGECEIGWRHSRLKTEEKDQWSDFGSGYQKLTTFAQQHLHFVRTIQGHPTESATLDDAMAAVTAIDAGYRSAITGIFEPI